MSNRVVRKNVSINYQMNFVEKCRNIVSMKILLDKYMNENNLTNRKVAYMTGVSKTTIGAIRNGRIPKMTTLDKIAKGLGIDLNDLYEP